jgi:hypothetical protein
VIRGLAPLLAAVLTLCAACDSEGNGHAASTTTSRPATGTPARAQPRPTCDAAGRAADPLADPADAAPAARAPRFVDVTCAAGLDLPTTPVGTGTGCIVGPKTLTDAFPELASSFADLETKYGGFCQYERFTGGVAVGDADGDGRPDLYVPRLDGPGRLFLNRTGGRFVDATAGSGLDTRRDSSVGAAWADIDNDGDEDLFVGGLGTRGYSLYVNDGRGHFVDEAGPRGIADDRGVVHLTFSVAVGDYDGDGYVDAYFTEYAQRPHDYPFPRTRSRLFHNRGGSQAGTFTDVTESAGVEPRNPGDGRYSWGATFTDLDGDHRPDLAVTGDFGNSLLFWNNGDGTFRNGTRAAGANTDSNGMGATTVDLDGDGKPDRVVTSVYDARGSSVTKGGNWDGTGNRVFHNDGNRHFSDATDRLGVRDGGWGWGVAAFDATNSGAIDLIQVSGMDYPEDYPLLDRYRSGPPRFWSDVGAGSSRRDGAGSTGFDAFNGRGLALLDFDGDGRVDVLVARPGAAPLLYRNVTPAAGHWVGIAVRGRTANRDGLNATVTLVQPDGRRRAVEVQSPTDFLGQSERVVHFGVGDEDAPSRVEVEFPSPGRRPVVTVDAPVDRVTEVREP